MALKKNKTFPLLHFDSTINLDRFYNLAPDVKLTPKDVKSLIYVFPHNSKAGFGHLIEPNGKSKTIVNDEESLKDPEGNLLKYIKTHLFNYYKKKQSKRNTISFKQLLEFMDYPNQKHSPQQYAIHKRKKHIANREEILFKFRRAIEQNDENFVNSLNPKSHIDNLNYIWAKPYNISVYNANETEKLIDSAIDNRSQLISMLDGHYLQENPLLYEIKQLLKYEDKIEFKIEDKQFYLNKLNEYFYWASKAQAEINAYNLIKFYIKNK